MKKLWLAVFLMAGLLAVSLLSAKQIRSKAERVSEQLELALHAGERLDAEAVARHTEKAAALWEAQVPLLDALTHHSEIDGVSGALRELSYYTGLRYPEEFPSRCAHQLHELEQIRELSLPLPQNIL